MKTNELTFAAVLTALILVIEVLAAKTGEALVILTIFSTLPLYILTCKKVKLGLMSYSIVALVLCMINFHQLIFFLFTNGLIGLTLGILSQYRKALRVVVTASISVMGLLGVSLVLGINLFEMVYKEAMIVGVIVIFVLMMIYCWFYDWFAKMIDERVNKIIKQNRG